MPITAILDTNVLVAGLRSSKGASFQLVQAVKDARLEIGLTANLVFEYADVLYRSGLVPMTPADVDDLLNYLCRVGRKAAVRFSIRPAAVDPKDDLVLEAAVATGFKTVVTYNVKDMAVGAREHGIEIVSPQELLFRVRTMG